MMVEIFVVFFVFILEAALFAPLILAKEFEWVTVKGMAALDNVTKAEPKDLPKKMPCGEPWKKS